MLTKRLSLTNADVKSPLDRTWPSLNMSVFSADGISNVGVENLRRDDSDSSLPGSPDCNCKFSAVIAQKCSQTAQTDEEVDGFGLVKTEYW